MKEQRKTYAKKSEKKGPKKKNQSTQCFKNFRSLEKMANKEERMETQVIHDVTRRDSSNNDQVNKHSRQIQVTMVLAMTLEALI